MRKQATVSSNENDITLDVESLPVIESEAVTDSEVDADADAYDDSDVDTDDNADSDSADDDVEVEEIPVIFKSNAPSDNEDQYCHDLKILALKLAELEDKFVNLEIKLDTLVNKAKKKKNKVKCKCKGAKVDISKCKCKSKKIKKYNAQKQEDN